MTAQYTAAALQRSVQLSLTQQRILLEATINALFTNQRILRAKTGTLQISNAT